MQFLKSNPAIVVIAILVLWFVFQGMPAVKSLAGAIDGAMNSRQTAIESALTGK